MRRVVLSAFLFSATFLVARAAADCPDPSGVAFNEIRYIDAPSPVGNRLHALIELYNRGTVPVALGGWTVTDESGSTVYSLPVLSLPGRSFLLIEFGTGTDDLDFSDGIGRIYTDGDSIGVLDPVEGGVALYEGAPTPAGIRDFVAWSPSGGAPSGAAASHAIGAGLWPAGQSVANTDSLGLFTIRLLPDGLDAGDVASWHHHGWGESWHQAYLAGPNVRQIAPAHGAGIEPGSVTLSWAPLQHASASVRVIVATDPSLATGIVVNGLTFASDTTVALADGLYYWTVRHLDACGEAPGRVWAFDVFTPPSAPSRGARIATPTDYGFLPIDRITQHRDSRLLCLWNSATSARPGCGEFAGATGPWDGPHPPGHALVCSHCGTYCVRASCQMINQFYGGNLTQDRLAFALEQIQSRIALPEANLAHGLGVQGFEIQDVLDFALSGEEITVYNATYAAIKEDIQAGYPVLVTEPGHAMVATGFVDAHQIAPGRPAWNMIRLQDPWPNRQPNRLVAFDTSRVGFMWSIRPRAGQTIAGRMQEPEVTTDSDGDGVMDFDEGAPNYPLERPRRLQSRHTIADTDRDDVTDKWEIRGYTFHGCNPNRPLVFPDIDGDGLRAEADCDSDNGELFDGGEDIAGRGLCALNTNPYNAADDQLRVRTDKPVYFVGEEVKLTGEPFRADTTYRFANVPECPDLVHGAPLGSTGALTTTTAGTMPFQKVADCTTPGAVLTVVDILHNSTYEEPRCQNPQYCWSCLAPIYRSDLDDPARWPELSVVRYHPGSVDWQFTPDFMHNQSGFHAELNGPGQPSNPINVGLRLPMFNVQPGEQVLLTYWTAFFSQGMTGAVRVSTDNGNSWTPVRMYGPPENGFNGVEVVDLTPAIFGPSAHAMSFAAAAATVTPCLVEFHAIGPPGSGGWFLDDLSAGRIPPGPTGIDPDEAVPTRFVLAQNNPNPFAGTTTIVFEVPRDAGRVKLRIVDVAGRLVRTLADGPLPPGRHVRVWDGRDERGGRVSAGMYFCRLSGDHWSGVRRMSRAGP